MRIWHMRLDVQICPYLGKELTQAKKMLILKGSDQRDEWGVESMLKQCLYI